MNTQTRTTPIRKLLRSLPPIAKRDRTIATLRQELKQAKQPQQDVSPSMHFEINRATRQRSHYKGIEGHDSWSDYAGFRLTKNGVRQVAERLNLNLPEIYGHWDSLDDIPFETLPEAIVVKSKQGVPVRECCR